MAIKTINSKAMFSPSTWLYRKKTHYSEPLNKKDLSGLFIQNRFFDDTSLIQWQSYNLSNYNYIYDRHVIIVIYKDSMNLNKS
jgi:hypothetical protein